MSDERIRVLVVDDHDLFRSGLRRLLEEIEGFDVLGEARRGEEAIVFDGADRLLSHAVAVHTEVSFVNLYRDQPSFADIDRDLRSRGFVPHTFAAIKQWAVAPVILEGNFRVRGNQLLEGDIVYFRDIGDPDGLDHG